MNKLSTDLAILIFTFSLSSFTGFAQNQTELWGMTKEGGTGGGVIFKTDSNGDNQQLMNSFIEDLGRTPYSHLCQASNGKLYGMTHDGGVDHRGVLFEYDPATDTYTKKLDFGITDGRYPYGSLMQASNGKLYGMTNTGGAINYGVLFEYDPDTDTYTKKLDFEVTNGSYPHGSLMQASNGKLYGMTNTGGVNDMGVLFEYDTATTTCTKKLDFAGTTNGSYPYGSLMQASNGKLYGMTNTGGANDMGVLFEYDTATANCTKKLDFAGGTNGSYPRGSLIQASNGKLYGMTFSGGANDMGVLFEYNTLTDTYTKKLDFDGATNGSYPYGSLMLAPTGKLYGMTHDGGTNNMGVLFEYDPATDTFTKKLDFTGTTNGSYPYGSLMQASNGKLYGMTHDGGANDMGVIFEYDTTTTTCTKKLDFTAGTDENNPYGSLMQASNGKLYGMTAEGGGSYTGVLFEYDPATDNYTKKLNFYSARRPYGSLMQASNGKLYGMTEKGGANDMGVLFEYDPATVTYTKKLDFGIANGGYPRGSLMQASNGKLYGMNAYAGAFFYGVLFEYDLATTTYTKKLDFAGATNGGYPEGSLMQASNGKLFGMTVKGGANNMGVLFEYDPATGTYTKKLDFDGATNGSYPYGSLMQASNGKLYGMTAKGGANDMGVLFEYDTATTTCTKKLDFNGVTNGSHPYGSLIQASNGKLYGMTRDGGANDMGVIFEYDTATTTCTKKLDFNAANGQNPEYTHLIEICVPPKFIASILDASVREGENAFFITVATGNGITYQWQVDAGTGFSNLTNDSIYSDVTDDTLHITGATSGMNAYQYRCIVTSTCPGISIQSDTALLTVYPVYAFIENHSICNGDTYNWHGTNYTTAGTFTANYSSINGCDSIYTLHLTVNPAYAFTENHSICNGETYNWHGAYYYSSGSYNDSLLTFNGCDSVYVLNLSVISVDTSLTVSDPAIIANASGASYQWLDCDNAFDIIPGETSQSYTATANGNYAVLITQGLCSDTSACLHITTVGIASTQTEKISIYPNPVTNELIIEKKGNREKIDFEILNTLGQIVFKGNLIEKTVVQTNNYTPGVYLIKLQNGKSFEFNKIIKE